MLRLGAFDIPQVPAVYGTPIAEVEKGIEVDLDGVVGSGLLAAFRVTLTDGGRAMWLEDIPMQQQQPQPRRRRHPPQRLLPRRPPLRRPLAPKATAGREAQESSAQEDFQTPAIAQ